MEMVRPVVQRKKSPPVAQDELDSRLAAFAARKQFLVSAASMGWQLAGVVLVPVIIGVKLDDRFNSTPSYTLAALVLATGGAVWVVANSIKQAGRDQARADKEEKQ